MHKKKEISGKEIEPECRFNGNCNERDATIKKDLFLSMTKIPTVKNIII